MTMNKQIGLHFGALSDPIETQLTKQGFTFEIKEVRRFDAQAHAIVTLSLGFIMTDSMKDKCLAKLHANVVKHVCKMNSLSPVKTFSRPLIKT